MKNLLGVIIGIWAVTTGCQRDPQTATDTKQPEATATNTQPGTAETAAEVKWLTDFQAAVDQAKSENKIALVDFTGSDWCGWCIRLDEEVFSKQGFAEYAEKHLVPVKIDFPRRKKLPPAEQKANEALAMKYRIEGFPTLVLIDGEGKEVGRLGYVPGGPKAFIAELEKVKAAAGSRS